MKKLVVTLLLGLFLAICSGCNPMGSEKFKVEFKNPSAFSDLKSQVANVSVVNNQLVITGSTLSAIKTATLKNNSQQEVFQVESATDTQIIANGARAITIIAGSVFDLILADAYGTATFQVTFTVVDGAITTTKIANGAVTAAKLDSMGASAGQFLKYNGTTWVAASVVDGQTFISTWDASTNMLPAVSAPGDYYIVSVAGTFGTPAITYSAGDWIITDGYNWQKVGYSKSVSSFQGRKGIVTLIASDYVTLKDSVTHKLTGSSLNDLFDVNVPIPADGQVLKWNAAFVKSDGTTGAWEAGADNTGASGISLTSLSATAPIVYNNTTGAFSLSSATTSAPGSLSAADKTKLDGLTAIPTAGDGLLERFSGVLGMRTCAAGEILIWNSVGGWTCTTSLVLSGSTAQTLGMSRNTTADTAGNNLSIQASGATSLATDKSGGNLVLSGGTSTGTGTSSIQFQTSSAGASGAADNASSTKMTILGNGNVGIGTTVPTGKLSVAGSATDNAYFFYDNAALANGIDGQKLYLYRRGSTNSSMSFYIDQFREAHLTSDANVTHFHIDSGAVNAPIDLQQLGLAPVKLYAASAAGKTSLLQIAGYRTGDALRTLAIGVGSDAANTASFTGLSNYYFSGNVGIGTTSPSALLHIGSASVGTGVAVAKFQNIDGTCSMTPASAGSGIACSSDERLKENIDDVTGQFALDRILKLQAVTYNFKTDSTDTRHTGYIAQAIQKVAPEFVRKNDDGFFQVYYDGLIPWITEAIKALDKRLTVLFKASGGHSRDIASVKFENTQLKANDSAKDKEIAQLKKDNAEIKERLNKIDQMLLKNK